MDKILIKPSIIPTGGITFDKTKQKWVDVDGNILSDEIQKECNDDLILVYSGRKECIVICDDEEVRSWIKDHLSTADSYFPSVKFLTAWFDKHKFVYEVLPLKKAVKV